MGVDGGEVEGRLLGLADGGAQYLDPPHGTVPGHQQVGVAATQVCHYKRYGDKERVNIV